MKKVILKSMVMVMAVAMFASCKKEETSSTPGSTNPPPVVQVDKKADLVASQWNVKKVFFNGVEDPNHFAITAKLVYRFFEDGNFTLVATGASPFKGTWTFETAEQKAVKLKFTSGGTEEVWAIKTLTKTDLVWERTGSDNKTTRYEFKH